MNTKTKAIIAVIVAAIVLLGVLFINTTKQVELAFARIGAFVTAVVIIGVAALIVVLILRNKFSKKKEDSKESS